MSKIIVIVICHIVAMGCLLLRGCIERSAECNQFLELPRQQRHIQFEIYPTDKQVELYLCAMKVEPPDLGLADEIADKGESVIPMLVETLKTSEKEIDQEDIIYVFEVMSDHGILRGRKDLIAEIGKVVDNMKISQIKQRSLERLKKIEVNSE